MIGGGGGITGKAGDDDGEGLDEEGSRLDIPEVSASRIVERSAKIGGPGESARKTGAVVPKLSVNEMHYRE